MPFKTAISGLQAAQVDLNVIGNNIANSNTTGFKRSRAEFRDVYAVSNVGASSSDAGRGVDTSRVAQQFSQGNITFTDNALDLAVSGQGFFMLEDNGDRSYTRDGSFGLDRDGFIVNANKKRLLTFGADPSGNITGSLNPFQLSQANNPPLASSALSVGANFDANATPPPIGVFNPTDANSFNETTAKNIFDSQGGSHLMQMYFVRDAAQYLANALLCRRYGRLGPGHHGVRRRGFADDTGKRKFCDTTVYADARCQCDEHNGHGLQLHHVRRAFRG